MSDCTCKFGPPSHEGMVTKGLSYAIYVDVWDENVEFDPACPYHGEEGSMVRRFSVAATRKRRGRCAVCGEFGHDATEHDGDHDRRAA